VLKVVYADGLFSLMMSARERSPFPPARLRPGRRGDRGALRNWRWVRRSSSVRAQMLKARETAGSGKATALINGTGWRWRRWLELN